jgi:HEPN domain-containing protein
MDEAATELVRDWLTRASHDLRAARILAAVDNPLLDSAIYHCQQAVEKAVKAWLQSRDDPFPKTHDVEDLLEQAAKLKPDFQRLAKTCGGLNALCLRVSLSRQRG